MTIIKFLCGGTWSSRHCFMSHWAALHFILRINTHTIHSLHALHSNNTFMPSHSMQSNAWKSRNQQERVRTFPNPHQEKHALPRQEFETNMTTYASPDIWETRYYDQCHLHRRGMWNEAPWKRVGYWGGCTCSRAVNDRLVGFGCLPNDHHFRTLLIVSSH